MKNAVNVIGFIFILLGLFGAIGILAVPTPYSVVARAQPNIFQTSKYIMAAATAFSGVSSGIFFMALSTIIGHLEDISWSLDNEEE